MKRLHRISIAMTSLSRPLKVRRRRGTFSHLLVVAGILFGLATVVNIHRFAYEDRVDHYTASEEDGGDENSKLASSSTPPPVSFVSAGIRVHREQIEGRDVLWASPQDNDRGNIKGLLFLAHGCGHSNLDWFARTSNSPECEDCVGLPEEAAIVQTALDMGLVAIALSSSNWKTKCWNGFDITPVALVLNELWHRFSEAQNTSAVKKPTTTNTNTTSVLEDNQPVPRLPLYAFGASSGGTFVSTLASPLLSRFGIRLDGFISQIAAQLPLLKEDQEEPTDLCRVYVTMNRDSKTDRAAQARVQKCQQPPSESTKGSSSSSSHGANHTSNDDWCKQIRLPPLPIKPEYFANRIPDLSLNESYEMVKILTKHGFLRPDTGELMEDPRKTHEEWSQALQAYAAKPRSELAFLERGDNLRKDQSPIFEVLNVAWGFHEMSREGVKEALEFCIPDKSQPTEK